MYGKHGIVIRTVTGGFEVFQRFDDGPVFTLAAGQIEEFLRVKGGETDSHVYSGSRQFSGKLPVDKGAVGDKLHHHLVFIQVSNGIPEMRVEQGLAAGQLDFP